MGSLGFDRSPSKNLEKSLSCSQPRLYEGSSTCRSHRGFLRQGWYLEVQKFLCWSNKPTQWKQWFQISLSCCWASALCSGKRRQKGMVFISFTLQLQYNTYNVNALHAGLEGFFLMWLIFKYSNDHSHHSYYAGKQCVYLYRANNTLQLMRTISNLTFLSDLYLCI